MLEMSAAAAAANDDGGTELTPALPELVPRAANAPPAAIAVGSGTCMGRGTGVIGPAGATIPTHEF